MKKNLLKKCIATALLTITMASAFSISASAESASWSLARSQTISYSKTIGLYKYGHVEYLKNDASSNDGVNLYLDYAIPGSPWKNAHHVFAERGTQASALDRFNAVTASSWRGNMQSWWYMGKNCSSTGKFHAYN